MEAEQGLALIWDKIVAVMNYKLFDINQTPITIFSFVLFMLFLIVFFILSRVINKVVLKRVLIRFDIDRSIQFNMVRISHYIFMLLGTLLAFQFVGIDLSGLAVIFGALSVGIGFGLQNITSNFISGIILLFERPIRVGDRITVGDVVGEVASINMRSTTVQSLNNITIIVPNSDFVSGKVTNWSHGDPKVRLDIAVGVSYNSDLDTVIRALHEVADENENILRSPQHDVLFSEFGDSSWNMLLRVWIPSPQQFYILKSEINCAIVRKFREYNIEIPFPQRDLHVRSPLPVPFAAEAAE
ncbi:MAG: mechanosensitive ion channel [Candidatus Zixiibacteriota bacterium]